MSDSKPSDWRVSADYDYFDALTPEQTAFEFLRRNADYAASFEALAADQRRRESPTPAPEDFARRWGLRFRGRPRAARRRRARRLAPPPQSSDDPAQRRAA